MLYNIFIERYTRAAKNAGIISSSHPTKSDWSTGRLRWNSNYRERKNYLFEARNDEHALQLIQQLFRADNPSEKRQLAGKSYLRDCRVQLESK